MALLLHLYEPQDECRRMNKDGTKHILETPENFWVNRIEKGLSQAGMDGHNKLHNALHPPSDLFVPWLKYTTHKLHIWQTDSAFNII